VFHAGTRRAESGGFETSGGRVLGAARVPFPATDFSSFLLQAQASGAMLIHLAAHAAYHGCDRLIWLYDIRQLVATHAGEIDWELVVDRSRAWGLALPVLTVLKEVRRRLGPVCPAKALRDLEATSVHWKDRLALHAAPRAGASPLINVASNLLSTPGVRFRIGYALALLRPGAAHLGECYPYRHTGWKACAHTWRVARSFARLAALPYQGGRSLTRRLFARPDDATA